jgi:EAL domain-containing protein (putative c-di-GMP-specific phosphodiesterase class I)
MATRGHLGGLSVATPQAARLLDACGFDRVLIETVGVGQVEVEVAGEADTTVVVVNPGWGDAVQANKAGLMEIADIFVINKADRAGEPETRRDLEQMLEGMIEDFLDHPFRLDDAVFRVAARTGVALFPEDGADADTLFKNAEAALKLAKARGEPYLFYTRSMNEAVSTRLTLENQLRQALDNEEFVLHYQPKVNLVTGKLTSAEALIRWNDPRTGLVPPGKFIPVLEETGMIYDVGRWALRRAVEDYMRWCSAGLSAVRIAVNVSPLQLRNRGFISEIREALGVDPRAAAGLELEITESLIMENVKQNIASLRVIRDMGVPVAIDDFGTGFSSLSYLSRLPVDTLKIDRSFVIDMTAGPEGLSLVSTIINLAHSLKLKVVAEGVETEEQLRLLRLLGCDEMQGFLFSKPVPRDVFETKFLARPHLGAVMQ